MAFRLVKIGGIEVLMSIDDDVRASRLWQYVLKPSIHMVSSITAGIEGSVGMLARPKGMSAPMPEAAPSIDQQRILERIKGVDWFHTIDLGYGVMTPGLYNHTPLLAEYPIPERLDGMRVLDVGTMNGFWAFEFEKRGASEVVALDIERVADLDLAPVSRRTMPAEILNQKTSVGFEIARELKRSQVRREVLSVYELSPERLGMFDLVFVGDLLALLNNPIKALQNMRSVCAGQTIVVDFFNPFLPQRSMLYQGAAQGATWWSFSLSALEQMIRDADFASVTLTNKFKAGQRGRRDWMWRAAFCAAA